MPVNLITADNDMLSEFAPDPNSTIWRYMSIGKYLGMITSKQLWFTSIERFLEGDPWEGALTRSDYDLLNAMNACVSLKDFVAVLAKFQRHKEALETLFEWALTGKVGDLNEIRSRFLHLVRGIIEFQKSFYVSCWHSNVDELAGMWRLYVPGGLGVVVKSSIQAIEKALDPKGRTITIGKIGYYSGDATSLAYNAIRPTLNKRYAFSHENEIRLAFHDHASGKRTGVPVECHLPTLLEEVVVSPLAESWFFESVGQLTKKHVPGVLVRPSDLYVKPPV